MIYRGIIRLKWAIKEIKDIDERISNKIIQSLKTGWKWLFKEPERFSLVFGTVLIALSIILYEYSVNNSIDEYKVWMEHRYIYYGWIIKLVSLFLGMLGASFEVLAIVVYSSKIEITKSFIRKIAEVKRKLKQTEEEMLAEKKIKEIREEWRNKK